MNRENELSFSQLFHHLLFPQGTDTIFVKNGLGEIWFIMLYHVFVVV